MKARGGDDEGQGDEGANADHLKHVEEHGGAEAYAALEVRRTVGVGGGNHEAADLKVFSAASIGLF